MTLINNNKLSQKSKVFLTFMAILPLGPPDMYEAFV